MPVHNRVPLRSTSSFRCLIMRGAIAAALFLVYQPVCSQAQARPGLFGTFTIKVSKPRSSPDEHGTFYQGGSADCNEQDPFAKFDARGTGDLRSQLQVRAIKTTECPSGLKLCCPGTAIQAEATLITSVAKGGTVSVELKGTLSQRSPAIYQGTLESTDKSIAVLIQALRVALPSGGFGGGPGGGGSGK